MLSALLDEIIQNEGTKEVNDPADPGGRTLYGISERAHPEAWRNGPPTLEQAKKILADEYFYKPDFDKIQPDFLQDQLTDFAVNSGVMVAVRALQRVLGVPQDGLLGAFTFLTLRKRDPQKVNNLLVDERVKYLGRVVEKAPERAKFLDGWLERALRFRRT